jgi:hypothetical protein
MSLLPVKTQLLEPKRSLQEENLTPAAMSEYRDAADKSCHEDTKAPSEISEGHISLDDLQPWCEMIDLSQKMDWKDSKCEIFRRALAAVRNPAFRFLFEREWRMRLWHTNPKFESIPDRTTHDSRITNHDLPPTNYESRIPDHESPLAN